MMENKIKRRKESNGLYGLISGQNGELNSKKIEKFLAKNALEI